ncbi:predicted protein [Sclerotinia sclerotiorum 1980 UF-70]|uniref:Uncharacterized protein n=1 Tax=Sclerotinia sclerotiorum (strain ATCC 18683 / 1980 / Ss-1) TaxID=665079 RepID=A7EZ75_SCLS1|nr:predicted protein [Sclerotinia sclerotiorum 1980 UF-70]EDN94767.1 predicted protein [Sclerotinia sclerotiorum 1980 UF-70]
MPSFGERARQDETKMRKEEKSSEKKWKVLGGIVN